MFNNKRVKNLEDEINELKNYNNRYRNILSYMSDKANDDIDNELNLYASKYGLSYCVQYDEILLLHNPDMVEETHIYELRNLNNIIIKGKCRSLFEGQLIILNWIKSNEAIFTVGCKNKEIKKSKK